MHRRRRQNVCGLILFSAPSFVGGACSGNPAVTKDGGIGGMVSIVGTGGSTTVGMGGTNPSGSATDRGAATGTGGTTRSGNSTAIGAALSVGGSAVTGGTSGSGGGSTGTGSRSGGTSGSSGGSGESSTGVSTSIGSGGGSTGTGSHSGGTSGSSGGSGGSSVGGCASTGTGASFDPCPATGNCKILPLGDSITAGAGAQPGDNGGYRVELFTKAVNDSKYITFVGSLTSGPTTVSGQAFPKNHEGHIGWTITQINNIATTAQTVSVSGTSYAGALKDMPNIVLLFIGTNDEGYASSEAGASDRLATLIDKIVAALPNALLVVSSIYPFPGCKDTNYTPTQCAANVATYDAAIPGVIQQRVAQGKHVLFVDMSTPPTGALSTDGVHPNDTVGYPWMGDNWYAAIKSYLH